MLHFHSAEVRALILWISFALTLWGTVWLCPAWWKQSTWMKGITTFFVFCSMSRYLARGSQCQWPINKSFHKYVALVVGASSGVGYATAEELVAHGWTVIITGSHLQRLLQAKKQIMKKLSSLSEQRQRSLWELCWRWILHRQAKQCNIGTIHILDTVDLADEMSIRHFAEIICESSKSYHVHLLVNAAGVLHRELKFCTCTNNTEEKQYVNINSRNNSNCCESNSCNWANLERMLAVNAVGPLLLSQLLLPVLMETADILHEPSRIVNIASCCHTFLNVPWCSQCDPIQMIYGLEARSKILRSSTAYNNEEKLDNTSCSKVNQNNVTVEENVKTTPSFEPSYIINNFTWFNFVGYYGLSKLCVIWNTRLLAEQCKMLRTNCLQEEQQQQQQRQQQHDNNSEVELKIDNKYVNNTEYNYKSSSNKNEQIIVACAHPGVITTHLYRDLLPIWMLDTLVYWPSLLLGKTWTEAAQAVLKPAVEDDVVHGGYYLCDGEYGMKDMNSSKNRSKLCVLSSHACNVNEFTMYKAWVETKIRKE